MRLCVQVGRTRVWPSLRRVPWHWDWEQSLMAPLLFGVGVSIPFGHRSTEG